MRGARQRPNSAYKKIETDILRKVRRGVWPIGTQIPSRQQLARDYRVDVSTIQKAISALLTDGIVASDGTRGTYVSRLPAELDGGVNYSESNDAAIRDSPVANLAWETPRASGPHPDIPTAKKVVGIVGRFAPDISELLVPYTLAQAVENALTPNRNVALHFFDTFCDRQHSIPIREGAEKLLREQIDALCVIHPQADDVDAIMASAHRSRTPVLFIPQCRLSGPELQVHIDHCYDGYQAAKFYLDMGHRALLFIRFGTFPWTMRRLDGVRAAVQYAGLPPTALAVYPKDMAGPQPMLLDDFRAQLRGWVRQQISQGEFRGAIIAANDEVALEVLDVAQGEGMAPNQGYSLIGFDDIPAARRKGLTTLRPPLYDMGHEAARLLTALLQDDEVRGRSISSSMISQVVARSTTL